MGRSATARGGLVLAGAGNRNRTLFPRPPRARPGVPRLARPRAVNVRLVLSTAATLALVIALAACASPASTSTRPAPTSSPSTSTPHPAATTTLGCAWYSPTGSDGQVVNVTATGPACSTQALVAWLAAQTRRTWRSEPMIPGSFGELLAVERKAGSAVWVYFTGPEPSATTTGSPPERTQTGPPAAVEAGTIADDLMAAGWSPSP